MSLYDSRRQLIFSQRNAQKIRELEAQVDRLTRALANIQPSLRLTEVEPGAGWRFMCCDVRAHPQCDLKQHRNHAKDCVYVWAVEHNAAMKCESEIHA